MSEAPDLLPEAEAVAIIGMAGRFPRARTLAEYWDNLRNGRECITFFSAEELAAVGVDAATLAQPGYVRAAAVLDDIEQFDAAFFGFNRREAEVTDPQHRFFLECSWEALEDAGCVPERFRGRIGVYAGASMSSYLLNLLADPARARALGDFRTLIGNDKDYLPMWVSYKLDLTGPSINVQSSCSTSLVAVHSACQSLLNGECDMALAGGAAISARQRGGYLYREGGITSPDGHCRSFDEKAQGTVGGNGVGVVVLKRLADALAAGDVIRAVIRGSAVNNDGSRRVGFTAPSEEGQAKVISEALAVAGLEPADISYVEAHGTATALGDRIEITALNRAFRQRDREGARCAIGSVKTNIGHLDAAAGVAGLIKTVLSLEHRLLPPSLHFERPHPNIGLADSPFFVNARLAEWPAGGQPRRAGVSSFGIGGTNAHVVVEEAPAPASSSASRAAQVLVLSARTAPALDAAAGRLAGWLRANPAAPLADVAFTLQTGRRAFSNRRLVHCRDGAEAVAALEAPDSPRVENGVADGRFRPIAFLFPGQGSQHPGMGAGLYRSEPRFRSAVDRCSAELERHLGFDLRQVLYADGADGAAAERLEQTAVAQPALFVVEYALAELWRHWGIVPNMMIGHSVGEYVAACLAGVFSLADALALVAARGRLMQEMPPGVMLAVYLSEAEILPLLGDDLALAAINGPARSIVSGPAAAVAGLEAALGDRGVASVRLKVSHAFHSAMMDAALPAFLERVRAVPLAPPRIPYMSNLTGSWISAEQATSPEYWVRQLRHTVRFAAGVGELLETPDVILLEAGPGHALSALARLHPKRSRTQIEVSSLPGPRGGDEEESMLAALGRLWLEGVEIDWPGFYAGERRRRVPLPAYPFERQRYWIDAMPRTEVRPPQIEIERGKEPMAEAQTAAVTESPRKARILQVLKDLVRDLTGLEPEQVREHDDLFTAGLDSLLAIQATQSIQNRLGLKLSIVQIFEELTTLDRIAAHIDGALAPDALADLAPVSASTPVVAAAAIPTALPVVPVPAPVAAVVLPPAPAPFVPPVTSAPVSPPSPPAVPVALGGSSLDHLLAQQLQVMAQQLELLRQGAQTVHVAPPPTPALTPSVPVAAPALRPAPPPPEVAAAAPPPIPRDQVTSFGPFRPMERGVSGVLTPRQQQHLDALIARYNRRTRESKRLTEEHRMALADCRASQGFRMLWKEMVYPIHGERSRGSRVWDVDGNEYIDITMGFGLHLFGHSPDFLTEALERQLRDGIAVGPQSRLSGEAARLLCELTGMDRAIFCNSGTESVMGALRAARVFTRRERIAQFSGAYHGWADGLLARSVLRNGVPASVPQASGIPGKAVEDTLVLDFDKWESLEILAEHGHELAAVLVEPIQSRRPDWQPREFLRELRRVTEATGTVLIFDEMITGFRLHSGGAQAYFGVKADLATYGKLVAGGLPVGVVAGRAPVMDMFDGGMWQFGDGSYPPSEKIQFAGAFFKNPLTMAAARAILGKLKEEGPALQERLSARTAELAADLNGFFLAESLPMRIVHFGNLFRFEISRDLKYSELLFFHLIDKGVLFSLETGHCFLTTAHTDADVAFIAAAVKESVHDLQDGGFFPKPPSPVTSGDEPLTVAAAGGGGGNGAAARGPAAVPRAVAAGGDAARALRFGLYYFGCYDAAFSPGKYDLLLAGARFADERGFSSLNIPERHFHAFGGLSPNPSVLAAALARETRRIQIRAGSLVLPLHHPIRVAEEWSVVDNLSGGRVGIAFGSGWHPDDFVFAPQAYGRRREVMLEGIETVRRLWRGEAVAAVGGAGNELAVRLFPMPMQRELPIWLTAVHRDTYETAGRLGAGVLTNLLAQPIDELEERIRLYRETLVRHGHDPAAGNITVLVHTFLDEDHERARGVARGPFLDYLKASFGLQRNLLESFGRKIDFDSLSAQDVADLMVRAYDRIVESSTLIGSPQACGDLADRLAAIGVDEVACFIDFGVASEAVLEGLEVLDRFVRQRRSAEVPAAAADGVRSSGDPGAGPPGARAAPIRVPMTEGQKGLWILAQMDEDASRAYNESVMLRLRGPLRVEALRRALAAIVARHEALRTVFSPEGDDQIILPDLKVDVPSIDFSALEPAIREARVEDWLAGEAARPFDFEHGPLLRLQLATLDRGYHVLVLTIHHIIVDSQSCGVIFRELSALYSAECRGVTCELPEPLQFRHYALRERPEDMARAMAEAEEYWLRQFADSVPSLELPTDRPRPPVQTYAGSRLVQILEAPLYAALRQASARHGSSLAMLLLAAYEVLLHRLSGQDDVVVGVDAAEHSAVAGRALVGLAVNPLPLRFRVADDPLLTEHLPAVRRKLLEGYERQNYSFRHLAQRLKLLQRDPSRPPLYAAAFNLEVSGDLELFGLTVETVLNPPAIARFDLNLNNTMTGDVVRAECELNTDLFDETTIRRWLGHYRQLLHEIVADPARRLSELPLLSAAERQQLLTQWNDTAVDLPDRFCAHQRFEAQAARRPNAVAASCAGRVLTYRELDRRADRLAQNLVRQGVREQDVVPLIAERGLDFLVAMLAIWKAGAVYLPLDPQQPGQRTAQVLAGCGAEVVLAAAGSAGALADPGAGPRVRVLILEELLEKKAGGRAPLRRGSPEHLAYVIYTSGSTGAPKGAMVEQRGMLNHLDIKVTDLALAESDVVAQTAAQSFDISVWQFLAPLLVGGRVEILDGETVRDPVRLVDELAAQGVTVFETVPSLLRLLLDEIATRPAPPRLALRWLLVTGEAFPAELGRRWLRSFPAIPMVNAYGPTECSDDVTHHRADRLPPGPGSVPIGRSLANTRLYLLDPRLEPVPIGVAGELHVAGAGVGRGYWNDAARTAEVFLPDPFTGRGERMYRTGDRIRQLPDGTLEFLDRIDHQVKVRGFRIELGEIESVLAQHPEVAQCVVLAREDAPGDRRLVAYLVARHGADAGSEPELRVPRLRTFLGERLPAYMVPASFMVLDAMPLTPNGKVDRRALPAPEGGRSEAQQPYEAPRDATERLLAEIWGALLGVERVSIHDNFFELGGDSILGIQIIARANRDGLGLNPHQLFQYPTVAGLAAVASPFAGGEGREASTAPIPLTPAQRWFFERAQDAPHAFRRAVPLEMREALNPVLLGQAVDHLLARHEALRVRFARGDSWRQAPAPPVAGAASWSLDLSALGEAEQARAMARAEQDLLDQDLEGEPLLRVAAFDRGAERPARVLLVGHRLITDSASWQILLADLDTIYQRLASGQEVEPPAAAASFRRWAEALGDEGLGAEVEGGLAHRQDARRLRVDLPGSAAPATIGSVPSILGAEQTTALFREVPEAYGTRIEEVLLTALVQAVAQWQGWRSLLVEIEGDARSALRGLDAAGTVGWLGFVAPVHLDLGRATGPGEALSTVKEQLRAVPAGGLGPGLPSDLPAPEVRFTWQGSLDGVLAESRTFRPAADGGAQAMHGWYPHNHLELAAGVGRERLELVWRYRADLYHRATVEALAGAFETSLSDLIAHCRSRGERGYTPSDFPMAKLSQEQLDRILRNRKAASSGQ